MQIVPKKHFCFGGRAKHVFHTKHQILALFKSQRLLNVTWKPIRSFKLVLKAEGNVDYSGKT
jgi:hypothetical protein